VELRVRARCVEVRVGDKYDAHGHVTEVVRKHDLRIDRLEVEAVEEGAALIAEGEGADVHDFPAAGGGAEE
jgi:hypothetical protein